VAGINVYSRLLILLSLRVGMHDLFCRLERAASLRDPSNWGSLVERASDGQSPFESELSAGRGRLTGICGIGGVSGETVAFKPESPGAVDSPGV
jgi:hypothetical protein